MLAGNHRRYRLSRYIVGKDIVPIVHQWKGVRIPPAYCHRGLISAFAQCPAQFEQFGKGRRQFQFFLGEDPLVPVQALGLKLMTDAIDLTAEGRPGSGNGDETFIPVVGLIRCVEWQEQARIRQDTSIAGTGIVGK